MVTLETKNHTGNESGPTLFKDLPGDSLIIETELNRLADSEAILSSGAATAGSATTLTDSSKSYGTNALAGQLMVVKRAGVELRTDAIISNTATVITVASGTAMDALDTFDIYAVAGSGSTSVPFACETLKFPATQVPSADANTLDDYEEGTWTPDVNGTTPGTTTFTTQLGKYIKVGRQVTVTAYCIWTSSTGSGNFRIYDLPFVSANDGIRTPCTVYFADVAVSAGATVVARINENINNVVLIEIPSGGGAEGAVAFDTAGTIYFSATYTV